jgi:hypothetical protein
MPEQFELIPHVYWRLGEIVHELIAMIRRRRDAKPLSTSGHGRIIDRLNIDLMFGRPALQRA